MGLHRFNTCSAYLPTGLQVIININQAEYSDMIGDTAGVRMVIHPQNRMPFPEDEGITISPGRATSVGIRQVRYD